MSARTSIGELAIHSRGRDYVFRPLFCRIEKLGTPEEIIELFNTVQQPTDDGFIAAWHILFAFADECEDEDLYALLGYFEYDDDLRCLSYIKGETPASHIHIMGASIIGDALVGRPNKFDRRKTRKGQELKEFNASESVAIGDANFSGIEWWNKTMIELYQAIKANGVSEEEKSFMDADEVKDLYKRVGL